MLKTFIIFVFVAAIAAQENGNPCNDGDQTDNNNEFNSNDNFLNRQQQLGFRGFNGGSQQSSNNYPRAADAPIGFGTNFPFQRFQSGQFGSNFPQQGSRNSRFGSQFGNQQSGQNGFGFGYGSNQNGQFGRNPFSNPSFGSNSQNFGSFLQGRQLQ